MDKFDYSLTLYFFKKYELSKGFICANQGDAPDSDLTGLLDKLMSGENPTVTGYRAYQGKIVSEWIIPVFGLDHKSLTNEMLGSPELKVTPAKLSMVTMSIDESIKELRDHVANLVKYDQKTDSDGELHINLFSSFASKETNLYLMNIVRSVLFSKFPNSLEVVYIEDYGTWGATLKVKFKSDALEVLKEWIE